MKTRIVLIRHGETSWNRDKVFRGRADVPLNEEGLSQAAMTGEALSEVALNAVFSSPLERARQTARAVADRHGLEVQEDPAFTDINFGEWQGVPHREVEQRYPEEYCNWRERPHCLAVPGGETLAEVRERAWRRLEELVAEWEGRTVAVVSHRVVLKLLLLSALGLENRDFWRLKQDTCAINVVDYSEGYGFVLNRFNETCHLKPFPAGLEKIDF